MTINYFGSASTPADNGSQNDGAARAITPPASMVAGDLVYLVAAVRMGTESISLSEEGGQSWTAGTLRQHSSYAVRSFWCRFNGMWSANPSVITSDPAANFRPLSAVMAVFRPTAGSNTWAIDVAETSATFGAPVAPYDVTAIGQTAIATSTVSIFTWISGDDNAWALQTAGFTNVGNAQYRNTFGTSGNRLSLSLAYKRQTSAGATGNVTNRQTANGGDPGRWLAITFKEQSSGVTVASAGDALFYDGETGIAITGTSFGATKGAGRVVASPSSTDIDDADAIELDTTSWSDTSAGLDAIALTDVPFFTTWYLFVENNSGQSNSNGFPFKREARMFVRQTLKSLSGTPVPSLSDIRYRITASTINGTELLSGLTETTDGSGNIAIGPYSLTEGGAISPGDDVWVALAIEGANQAASKGTCVKITPDYE